MSNVVDAAVIPARTAFCPDEVVTLQVLHPRSIERLSFPQDADNDLVHVAGHQGWLTWARKPTDPRTVAVVPRFNGGVRML